MIRKTLGTITVSILLSAGANAAVMSINGPVNFVIGESFELTIFGDFAGEGLIAGGVNFLYDPAIFQFDNVELNLPVVSDFSCPGSPNCPAATPGSVPIVWGEFLTDLIPPTEVFPVLMATLTFTAVSSAPLNSIVFSMVDNPSLTGGWFGAGFNPIDTPTFIDLRYVPLPAAAWLMIGGLASLGGFTRRRVVKNRGQAAAPGR